MAFERDDEGKKCPVCGAYFYNDKKEYCSLNCYQKGEAKMRACLICGELFYAKYSSPYCGDICKRKALYAKRASNKEQHKKRQQEKQKQIIFLLQKILEEKKMLLVQAVLAKKAIKKQKKMKKKKIKKTDYSPYTQREEDIFMQIRKNGVLYCE